MEILFASTAVLAGLAAFKRRIAIALLLAAFFCFGPVAWSYYQTSDSSLIWEIAFRLALIVVMTFVASRYLTKQKNN